MRAPPPPWLPRLLEWGDWSSWRTIWQRASGRWLTRLCVWFRNRFREFRCALWGFGKFTSYSPAWSRSGFRCDHGLTRFVFRWLVAGGLAPTRPPCPSFAARFCHWCVTARIYVCLGLDTVHRAHLGRNIGTRRVVIRSYRASGFDARLCLLSRPGTSIRVCGSGDRVDGEHVSVASSTPKNNRSSWRPNAHPHRYCRSDRSVAGVRAVAPSSRAVFYQFLLT